MACVNTEFCWKCREIVSCLLRIWYREAIGTFNSLVLHDECDRWVHRCIRNLCLYGECYISGIKWHLLDRSVTTLSVCLQFMFITSCIVFLVRDVYIVYSFKALNLWILSYYGVLRFWNSVCVCVRAFSSLHMLQLQYIIAIMCNWLSIYCQIFTTIYCIKYCYWNYGNEDWC